MVGDGALVGGEGVDEVFGQFLTFGEEVVLGVELVVDDLGDGFAIANGGEAVFVDALLDEVVDHGLGTTLGEVEVEGLTTYTVGVCGKFDGAVGIVVEELDEVVEGGIGLFAEGGLVVVVEDVVDEDGIGDGGEVEVDFVVGVFFGWITRELCATIEVACLACHHDVFGGTVDGGDVGTVGFGERLEVHAVATDDTYDGFGDGFTFGVHDVSGDVDLDGRKEEGVDVVVALALLAVGTEPTFLLLLGGTTEGHAEVVGIAVDGHSEMLEVPGVPFVEARAVDVETAHRFATIGAEIENAIGREGGEHLVGSGVDGRTEVFDEGDVGGGTQLGTPYVQTTFSTWHVADKIQPTTIGRYGGMGVNRERVVAKLEHGAFAEGGIGTRRGIKVGGGNLSLTTCCGVVHCVAIGGEGGCTFIAFGIDASLDEFGTAPFPLVVLAEAPDVTVLGACDGRFLVACRFVG